MRTWFNSWVVLGLISLSACGSSGHGGAPAAGGASSSGELPIVAAADGDVPYQFGSNPYGVSGGAFLAKANLGSETVVLDTAQVGKICLNGTVDSVPTPADGSHPPYSDYWGIELGFNLNQAVDGAKNAWPVPSEVTGFWFTVEGSTIPPMRWKATPTGKDPALEQDSCTLVTPVSGVRNQVLFSQMYVQCWNGAVGSGPTDISQGFVDVGLQVAAATNAIYPLDFCLTQVGLVLQ